MKHATVITLALALLLLAGCATRQTNATPPPPPVTAAASIAALAQAVNAANASLFTARDTGKLSQADLDAANQVCATIARAGKQINAVLRNGMDWPTQRAQMLAIVAGIGISQSAKALNPTAAATLAVSIAIWNEIAASVGGPTL